MNSINYLETDNGYFAFESEHSTNLGKALRQMSLSDFKKLCLPAEFFLSVNKLF